MNKPRIQKLFFFLYSSNNAYNTNHLSINTQGEGHSQNVNPIEKTSEKINSTNQSFSKNKNETSIKSSSAPSTNNISHNLQKQSQSKKHIIKRKTLQRKLQKIFTKNKKVKIYFSPPIKGQKKTCTDIIVEKLNSSKKSVKIQAYSFTSNRIVDALINAHRRGVNVSVILDKSYGEKECSKQLRNNGINVYIDTLKRERYSNHQRYNRGIAHNKIMIIDEKTVVTGSFNFTNAAEHNNTENLIILRSKRLLKKYIKNYNTRQESSILINTAKYPIPSHQKKRRSNRRKRKASYKNNEAKNILVHKDKE